jgi:hypothetical protein
MSNDEREDIVWENFVQLKGVISNQTTSLNCAKTFLAPVVEEDTEPFLDVSVAAKNAGNEEVKNSLPSTSQLTLILNNHFLRIRLRIATAISAQKDSRLLE